MTLHPYTRLFQRMSDPTVSDDSAAGFEIGDWWITATKIYSCRDASAGAAVWVDITAGGGATNLNALTDVTIAAVADKQLLTYNSGTGQWENGPISDLSTLGHFQDINRFGFIGSYDGSTGTTISFDPATYTFTLTDSGSGWGYYLDGVAYRFTGNKTIVLTGSPPTAEDHYIYFDDGTGTLKQSTTAWSLEGNKIPVAMVLWNNALTPKYWLGDERHTSSIDRRLHLYLHTNLGSRWNSGGVPSGYSIAPSSPTDANNTFGISEAVLFDEDIKHTLNALVDPDGSTNSYVIMFKSGGSWVWEYSTMPYRFTAAGYIQYDNAGTMTQGQNIKYYNTYLLITHFREASTGVGAFQIIHGKQEFTSLSAAQAEDPYAFDFTGFPLVECVIGWQFTWQTNSAYSSKGECRLAATPKRLGTPITTSLAAPFTLSAGGVPTDTTNFNGNLSTLDTNVQKALDTLDNLPPKFVNSVTPTWSSSPVNNYDTTGADQIQAMVGPGTIELTGMDNGVTNVYVYLYVLNASTGNLLLKHLDGRSTSQFRLPGQQDMYLAKSEGVLLYKQTATTWVVLGTTSGSLMQGVKVDPALTTAAATSKIMTYDGTKLTLTAPSREVLAADRTYYVRTDGSDSNTGLANTAGGAFLTIQKAIDTIATLDAKTYNLTVQVAAGSYGASPHQIVCKNILGSGTVSIVGDTGTPANVVLDQCFNKTTPGTVYYIAGFKFLKTTSTGAYNAIQANTGANIYIGQNNYSTGYSSHLAVDSNAILVAYAAYTISGGCPFTHLLANTGGIAQMGGPAITLSGTPAIGYFTYVTRGGIVAWDGTTFTGSATGIRYSVDTNGIIYTGGGGANYFPGNSAGSAGSGGQYV